VVPLVDVASDAVADGAPDSTSERKCVRPPKRERLTAVATP
jgi:hypothetical protein